MTTYNFDREIDRKKTNSLKYDFAVERGRDVDVLPLWVADMDFQAPKPVLDALQNAVSHGIFGYSEVKENILTHCIAGLTVGLTGSQSLNGL